MASLRVIEGGRAAPHDFDAESDRFWAEVAAATGEAIKGVSVDHPERAVMCAVTRDARAAAGLPAVGA